MSEASDVLDARRVCRGAVRTCRLRGRGATATTDRDHALERLRPADGVHGWDWSTGVVRPSTVLWDRSVHVGVQPREHTSACDALAYGGVGTAGSALLRLGPPARARWRKDGLPDHGPSWHHDQQRVGLRCSQLQNIANGRGWIGLTYWNGGTAPVHPNGTAVDAAASGPLDTSAYWGIELRCVAVGVRLAGGIQLSRLTVYASEAQGPSITPVADPGSLWNHAGAGGGSGTRQVTPWPLPVSGADSSGVCSLSVQAGASAPIADPSLPAPNDSSWQECHSQRVGQGQWTRASTSAVRGSYP